MIEPGRDPRKLLFETHGVEVGNDGVISQRSDALAYPDYTVIDINRCQLPGESIAHTIARLTAQQCRDAGGTLSDLVIHAHGNAGVMSTQGKNAIADIRIDNLFDNLMNAQLALGHKLTNRVLLESCLTLEQPQEQQHIAKCAHSLGTQIVGAKNILWDYANGLQETNWVIANPSGTINYHQGNHPPLDSALALMNTHPEEHLLTHSEPHKYTLAHLPSLREGYSFNHPHTQTFSYSYYQHTTHHSSVHHFMHSHHSFEFHKHHRYAPANTHDMYFLEAREIAGRMREVLVHAPEQEAYAHTPTYQYNVPYQPVRYDPHSY